MGENEPTTNGGSGLRGDGPAGTGDDPVSTEGEPANAKGDEADPRVVLVSLWQMSRPAQLALIALVYGLGVTMAVGRGVTADGTAPATVSFGLAALLPTAASVHYANEYADVETDALTDRTPQLSPSFRPPFRRSSRARSDGGDARLAETAFGRRPSLLESAALRVRVAGRLLSGRVLCGLTARRA